MKNLFHRVYEMFVLDSRDFDECGSGFYREVDSFVPGQEKREAMRRRFDRVARRY